MRVLIADPVRHHLSRKPRLTQNHFKSLLCGRRVPYPGLRVSIWCSNAHVAQNSRPKRSASRTPNLPRGFPCHRYCKMQRIRRDEARCRMMVFAGRAMLRVLQMCERQWPGLRRKVAAAYQGCDLVAAGNLARLDGQRGCWNCYILSDDRSRWGLQKHPETQAS